MTTYDVVMLDPSYRVYLRVNGFATVQAATADADARLAGKSRLGYTYRVLEAGDTSWAMTLGARTIQAPAPDQRAADDARLAARLLAACELDEDDAAEYEDYGRLPQMRRDLGR